MSRKNYISDRANLTASVILNKRGEHVATVQFFYGSSGTVYCEVWNTEKAIMRCLETALKTGRVTAKQVAKLESEAKYCTTPESKRASAAHELFRCQKGRASGYGYDKAAAALSGMLVDGHTMANHCGHVPEAEKMRSRFISAYNRDAEKDYSTWSAKARAKGMRFANGMASLYFHVGLERLSYLGYRVISAV